MGSIARLEDKPRNKCRKWRLFVSKGTVDGRRVQRSKRFDGTYTEAKAALARFEVESGTARASVYSSMPFSEYIDNWVDGRRGTVEDSTITSLRRASTTLKHVLGGYRMVDVTPKDVEDAYARLLRGDSPTGRQLKPSYVYDLSIKLWGVFNDAFQRGAIPSNPVASAKRPKVRTEEKEPPTSESVARMIAQLDMSDGHHAAVLMCAAMGLRKGESIALRWCDVDGSVLHVRHSLRQPTKLVATKTGAGRRDLPIPVYVADMLEERRRLQRAQVESAIADGLVDAKVDFSTLPIASDEMGRFITSEGMSCWWRRHRAGFGLKCTLHDLRHAYLTTAALNGVPPRVMQALAGHASPVTTMKIYAHANMGAKEDAARAIASVLHPNG